MNTNNTNGGTINHLGYSIENDNGTISSMIKNDLTVKPIVFSDYCEKIVSFPIYRISKSNKNKYYIPRYYGLTKFGECSNTLPDDSKIVVPFNGLLRDIQITTVTETIETYNKYGGGLISLDTGLGKTVVALKIISMIGLKTLIVVHAEFLLEQWIERIHTFLPTARIGVIRQDQCEYVDCDISVGMLQSIIKRNYPKECMKSFNHLIIDECFPYTQNIATEYGCMNIGKLYNMWINHEELPRVLSFNELNKNIEYKNITYAWKKENNLLLKISYSKSNIKCTYNHKILTPTGYVPAIELKIGDLIQCNYSDSISESMVARTLNEDQYQILLGSYLGDGHIHILNNNRIRLKVIHGSLQKEYCEWKAYMMNAKVKKIENNGYSKKTAYSFCTKLIDLPLDNTFNKHLKSCPQWVLDHLTAKGLAVWWMDDGSLSKRKNAGCLSTCSFDEETHIRIVNKIKSMGIDCMYRGDGKGYLSIYFKKEGIHSLISIIKPYFHENLKYKFDIDTQFFEKYNWNTRFLNYGTVKITSIEKINNNRKHVYDIEVEDNHNFICSTLVGIGPIVHNCHHTCSKSFSNLFFKVQTKYMLGLSATPERKDGLSKVIYWFLGPQIVNIKRTSDKPTIKFIFNDHSTEYIEKFNKQGKVNIPIMITDLTNCTYRNDLIIQIIMDYLKESRKILVLSHRRAHCENLNSILKSFGVDSGVYLGGMKMTDRTENVKKSVILGTYQASGEGFDVPELDTLVLSSPKSDVVQAVGRILRQTNNNIPVVLDIVDSFSIFKAQYYSRRKFYKNSEFNFN